MGIDCVTPQTKVTEESPTRLTHEMSSEGSSLDTVRRIAEGVNFTLTHFNENIFPRRIYTPIRKQIVAWSIAEVFRYFREAEFIDCRISAYAFREKHFIELFGQPSPDTIFIDIDKSFFNSIKAVNKVLNRTLRNIKDRFHSSEASPTIIKSGSGGYHIVQPIKAIDLSRYDFFTKWSEEPNREFLQFLEPNLSDNKADPEHYLHASFNNYLLRVPGSINSKTNTQVKIVQKWNGVRPDIKFVYGDYLAYLVDKRNEERKIEGDGLRFSKRYSGQASTVTSIIDWIEKLLNRPLGDFRKYCIWRIFTPYLINVKKLSYDDAFNVLKDWLKECDKITPLDFNANDRIKTNLRSTTRVGYLPVSFNKLKLENERLYNILQEKIIRQ